MLLLVHTDWLSVLPVCFSVSHAFSCSDRQTDRPTHTHKHTQTPADFSPLSLYVFSGAAEEFFHSQIAADSSLSVTLAFMLISLIFMKSCSEGQTEEICLSSCLIACSAAEYFNFSSSYDHNFSH